jgi:hypothetical protein
MMGYIHHRCESRGGKGAEREREKTLASRRSTMLRVLRLTGASLTLQSLPDVMAVHTHELMR